MVWCSPRVPRFNNFRLRTHDPAAIGSSKRAAEGNTRPNRKQGAQNADKMGDLGLPDYPEPSLQVPDQPGAVAFRNSGYDCGNGLL